MTAQDLKNAILQLAVQGKLVPQDPNDEPASELLKRIKAEKERLVKEGKIKREKPLSPISEDEIPFDIPESWEWVRLLEISSISSGGTPSRTNSSFWNGDIPWVKIGDISSKYVTRTEEMITEAGLNSSSANVFPKGTLLYTIFATIGTVGILDIDAATNQAVAGITFYGEYNLDYLYYILVGFKDLLVSKGKGMAQMNINQTILKNTPVPIPPLTEQQRIVAKIEELMPLVEEYGKAEERLTALNGEFPDKLRKSILQQAIQGKLTERDPADEPASELLKRIRAEKERLIKEGKLKKEKLLPPIAEEEVPFDIPDGWVWVRLQQIVFSREQETPTERFSYIDIGSIDNQRQCLNSKETLIDPENAPSRARKLVELGDILYSTVRPYLHNMCIIDREFSYKPIASTGFAVLACCAGVYNKFLFYYLLSPAFDNYVNDTAKGAAYPAINDNQLFRALIPLPPFAEQQRIVDRVNKLLAVCDELK